MIYLYPGMKVSVHKIPETYLPECITEVLGFSILSLKVQKMGHFVEIIKIPKEY